MINILPRFHSREFSRATFIIIFFSSFFYVINNIFFTQCSHDRLKVKLHTDTSSRIAVGVISSKNTLKRLKDGPINYWLPWAKGMNVAIYGATNYTGFPAVRGLGVNEQKDNKILELSSSMLFQIYNDYPDSDWYVKLDDDAVIFPSNFISALNNLDPSKKIIGGKLVKYAGKIFFSGGAGYFFSRPALKQLVKYLPECLKFSVSSSMEEDVIISNCAFKMIQNLFIANVPGMYPYDPWNSGFNLENFSPERIISHPKSFHHISAKTAKYLKKCIIFG